jgi:hypothetical protein
MVGYVRERTLRSARMAQGAQLAWDTLAQAGRLRHLKLQRTRGSRLTHRKNAKASQKRLVLHRVAFCDAMESRHP